MKKNIGLFVLIVLAQGAVHAEVSTAAFSFPGIFPEIALPLRWKVVDLTQTLKESVPTFPGGVNFTQENLVTIDRGGHYSNRISLGEHTGTHVDAPSHFAKGGRHVSQIPAEALAGPCVVIDVRTHVERNPEYQLTPQDIYQFELRQGARIPEGAIVLLHTGQGRYWPDVLKYRGVKLPDTTMRFPGFGKDAAEFLIRERKIRGLGIDALSADFGPSTTFQTHKVVLGANRYIIENLTNLENLPPLGALVIVAPLKIDKGSGAPARVLALVPER